MPILPGLTDGAKLMGASLSKLSALDGHVEQVILEAVRQLDSAQGIAFEILARGIPGEVGAEEAAGEKKRLLAGLLI